MIHVAWYNQQAHILLLTFPVSWTWDDFAHAYREVLDLTCHLGHPVDVILDMRHVQRLPAHALNHAARLAARWDDTFGHVVFVTDQPALFPFGYAARTMIPRARRRAHHTTTLEAADHLLTPHNAQPAPLHYA